MQEFLILDSAEPNDSSSSHHSGCSYAPRDSDKVESAERQGHSTGHRKSNSDRKRNGKESGKLEPPERESAKAVDLESETA
ncbi:hypothetical protein ACFXOR_31885, partial [Streptomyces sp. NPDC059164]|uniref:hypothetical protein n=1 Tax=Streptomyces sp. NPDC059164 TaxID=3346750 RepID=UPI0036AC4A52